MDEYSKINTIWKRDDRGRIIPGQFSTPEFEYLQDVVWEWTEKVDGTNIRVGWNGTFPVEFGGRTDNAQMPTKLVAALFDLFPADRMHEVFGDQQDVVLYGEGYGSGIQKGGVYRPDQSFVLFDVKVGRWWLKRDAVEGIAAGLGIDIVPVIGEGTLALASEITCAGIVSRWGDFKAEGLVMRPKVDLFDRKGERIIAKIKTRDFRA